MGGDILQLEIGVGPKIFWGGLPYINTCAAQLYMIAKKSRQETTSHFLLAHALQHTPGFLHQSPHTAHAILPATQATVRVCVFSMVACTS